MSTNRNSDDISTLIRSNEVLADMLDNMLCECYISPEMMMNYQENLLKCKRSTQVIKEKQCNQCNQ